MKRLLSLIMAILTIALSISACGPETPTTSTTTTKSDANTVAVHFLTGIDLSIESVNVEVGKTVAAPTFDPVDHYTLEGWYLDEEYTTKWNFETDVVTQDTILYAKWDFEPYEYSIKLPTTHLLTNATEVAKVEGAPDLMILEVVIDSTEYTMGEAMSNYEYIKIFNNTESEYNLKDHRIILANPASGQNGETEEARNGLLPLVTNYLFMGYIDEDFRNYE